MRVVVALLLSVLALGAPALERNYYLAVEEIDWDYAPAGRNLITGKRFTAEEQVFTANTKHFIGRRYRKAVYREYVDAHFKQRKERPAAWSHLGIMGPVMHAEVGDTIIVQLTNKASRPYSLHPHGVFYEKDSEGAPYADGTTGKDKADDAVAPGGQHTYVWEVPPRAGPGPSDPGSIAWLYHSHVLSRRDTNTGLVGAIIVTRRGEAKGDGSPKSVDREFVTLYTVMDENKSWYLDDNIAAYTNAAVDVDGEDFVESNLMHVINGYIYGNMPVMDMRQCDRVRWYTLALGTEVDLHTPHWHGNTGLSSGRRVDVVELLPASSLVVNMQPDAAGKWMYHCHVDDHMQAGMSALYNVKPVDNPTCTVRTR